MAEKNKKYYWLRLKRDFFKRHDIRIIESMPNGKDYILFYLKLLCESVDHEGTLRFNEQIPYNAEMLATITNTNIDVVRSAIKIFCELNMMEIMDDGTFFMSEVEKMIGSANQDEHTRESTRLRVQAFRERKKQSQLEDKRYSNGEKRYSNVTCNGEIEIELEKELELEKDIEKEKYKEKKSKPIRHKYGEYMNVLLSDEDMEKLKTEFPNDYEHRIEKLSSYMASTGKSYKNHLATIRNWARMEKERNTSNTAGKNKVAQQLDDSYSMMKDWAEE